MTVIKDKKYIGRDLPALQLDIVRADGSYLYDASGKKYTDFLMGWCVGNIGWGNKEIRSKLKRFNGPDYVNPMYLYQRWNDLAELIVSIAPGKLQKCFRATGGTEAVEIALQAAMSHTKRHKFISIEGSYHGHSIGAMSVGASDFRRWYPNLLFHCNKISGLLDDKAADKVEKLLEAGDIAAFIMEPIICNLGVVIPEKNFMKRIATACKKHGTLLIMDEVATGFGRTGKMFACEHYGIRPDILCLAKGITGGYGALGVTVMTSEVAKSMEFEFSFYSTFGWHPLNVEAAIANIEYLLSRKDEILTNTNSIGEYFLKRLSTMKFKFPAEVRVRGLAIGIEFAEPGYAAGLTERCQAAGLLFSTLGATIITLFPALTITQKVAKDGLDILEDCL